MHLLQVHFLVGMINEFMKGFEGGSRFAGAKRFALRRLKYTCFSLLIML